MDLSLCGGYGINTAVAWGYPKDNIVELVDEPDHLQPTRTNIVCLYLIKATAWITLFWQLKYLDLLVQASTPKTRLFLYCEEFTIPNLQTPLTILSQILGMVIKYGPIRRQSSMARTKVLSTLRRAVQERLTRFPIALVPLDWKNGLIRDNVSLLCEMIPYRFNWTES